MFRLIRGGEYAFFPTLSLIVLLAGASAARGQVEPVGKLRVSGTVSDRTGAPLPRVEIKAVDADGKTAALTQSNARGDFTLTLPPGSFAVTATLAGFRPLVNHPLRAAEGIPPLELMLEIPAIEQQVIVTATRTDAPVSQIGSSATVLTAEDMERTGSGTMIDTLRRVPGLAMVQSGPPGQVASLFIRGGESKYTKVLVDGIPVNEPGGSFNFTTLSSSDIERIEIVRGPQSALFGSDAMAGVVQVFTRRGKDEGLSPSPRVSVEGGSFATFRLAGGIEGRSERIDYSASFARSDTDNDVLNGSFNQETVAASLAVRPSRGSEILAVFRSEAGRAGVPGPWAFRPPEPDEYYRYRGFAGSLSFAVQTSEAWNQRFMFTASDSNQLSEDPADSGSTTLEYQGRRAPFQSFDFPFRTVNRTRRERFGYQSDFYFPHGHQLTLGGDAERESGTIGDPSFDPLRAVRRNYGGYVQDQWTFHNRLFAAAGVRVEQNESFGLSASPRASLALHLHQPTSGGSGGLTKLRASFGMGIKEPTLLESYSESPYFRGNPNLAAEESVSWDAGLEQHIGGGRGVVEIGYFENRFRNQITYVVTDYSTFEGTFLNVGKTQARGIEIGIRQDLGRSWGASGSYTFTASKIVESTNPFDPVLAEGQPLLRRPRHAGFMELGWRRGKLALSASGILVGERADSDFAGLGLTTNPGYGTLHLQASYRLASELTCFAALQNVLDKTYMEVLGYPALGRHFRLGLRAGF